MKSHQTDLLLVGSIPLSSAEEVLTECAHYVGDFVPALSDGEFGDRLQWIGYLYQNYYLKHPSIETTRIGESEWSDYDHRTNKQYKNTSATPRSGVVLRVKPNVSALRFERLGYAQEAIASYKQFKLLKEKGVIKPAVRFQVCLPFTYSATAFYFRKPEDWPIITSAYEDAIKREIAQMLQVIPAEELMLQWDVCWEILDLEGYWPYSPSDKRLERNSEPAARLNQDIPDNVMLGYHICYGTAGGWPMKKPKDMSLAVNLVNALSQQTPRPTDFFHIPVGRKAFDSDYYAALKNLKIGDARVYLGLIHDSEEDLVDFKRRLAAATQHLPDFGLASVCGYGRCNPSELRHALQVHRNVMFSMSNGSSQHKD